MEQPLTITQLDNIATERIGRESQRIGMPVEAVVRQLNLPWLGSGMPESPSTASSRASSLEEIGEFWDTHDFTEHDTDAPDVAFTIARAVQIEAELLAALEQQARLRGVGLETLVNLWLQQKLNEEAQTAAT